MKRYLVAFLFCLLGLLSIAQETLKDTVKVKTVEIKQVRELKTLMRLDSSIINHPVNQNLGELLSRESHLFVKSYGIGSLATISLRGTGSSHTQMYWNGIPINSSTNGAADLSLFNQEFIDEIELEYGLKSMKLGSGGIGGAIQLNNKPSFIKQTKANITHQRGSFGRESYSVNLNHGNVKFQSKTKVLYKEADNNFEYKDLTVEGFPQKRVRNASLKQKGVMQSFHYRPKESQLLEAFVWWNDIERNLPPLITLRENKEKQNDESFRALLGYKKYFEKSHISVKSAYVIEELLYQNERAGISSTSKIKGFRNLLTYKTELSDRLKLSANGNFIFNQAESASLLETAEQKRISGFVGLNYALLPLLTINLEVRQELILEENDFFLPALSVNYFLSSKKEWSLYSIVGKNIKYPSLNDLYWQPSGNSELQAEKANTLELGTQYSGQIKSKLQLNAQFALFAADIQDYIQWRPTAFGYWTPQNLSRVETKGLEVSVHLKSKATIVKKYARFLYSYTSSINHERVNEFDQSVGKQLIYIPEHKVNNNIGAEYKGYQVDINYQMIGERFITTDNKEFLPMYSLLDLTLGKRIPISRKHTLNLKFSVLNLLNEEYQAIEWRPMPNRNYNLTVQYNFSK